jgi:hypothetical protein
MANLSTEDVPVCKKDGDWWVIKTHCASPVRTKDRALANDVWNLAMQAYRNGHHDALKAARAALGMN